MRLLGPIQINSGWNVPVGRPGPPSGAARPDQIRTAAARALSQNKRSPAGAAGDEEQRREADARRLPLCCGRFGGEKPFRFSAATGGGAQVSTSETQENQETGVSQRKEKKKQPVNKRWETVKVGVSFYPPTNGLPRRLVSAHCPPPAPPTHFKISIT